MSIVFFCRSCGARFDVPDALSGLKARCKRCGEPSTIPKGEELASAAALPTVPPAPRSAAKARASADAQPPRSWIDEVSVNVGLAPVSVENLPAVKLGAKKAPATPLDNFDDDGPAFYDLARPEPKVTHRMAGKPAGMFTRLRREILRTAQKPMRFINDTTYLVSIPFLMLILLGAAIHSRPLALLGATAVVVLNAGRLVSGLANLALIAFKDGTLQGIGFLIPPFTLLYMWINRFRLRKPIKRVAEPLLTVGLVFLAFALIPDLGNPKAAKGKGVVDRIESGARALERDMLGEVRRARTEGVGAIGKEALDDAKHSLKHPDAPDPDGKP